jgi:hypothetical protein
MMTQYTILRPAHLFIGLVILQLCTGRVSAQGLESELRKLIQTYGPESVARTVARLTPSAAESAKKVNADGTAIVVPEEEKEQGFHGFLIRRSYSDVSGSEDPSVKSGSGSYERAQPAQFSFTHDYLADSNEWGAVVSVIRPFRHEFDKAGSPTHLVIDSISFVPSVSLQKISNNKDHTHDVDSLTFRAGFTANTSGGFGIVSLNDFRAYATYATNTGFNSGIVAGELEWEPTTGLPGNGSFFRIGERHSAETKQKRSLLELFWRIYAHAEFGGVTTGSPDQADSFFRIGPVTELTLDPLFLQRMKLSLQYSYLAGLSGQPHDSHHFLSTLSYVLDRDPNTEHWSLSASYEEGETPLVEQKIRTFLLTLGVKY